MTKKSCLLIGLFAVAAVLLIVGITQGQPGQVLMKAASVCLECVGIG